jgi:SAM-dependent methyltransferase
MSPRRKTDRDGWVPLSPAKFWDELAPEYDEFVASTWSKQFKPEDEAEFFDELFKGRRLILDLGCGTGRTIRLLSGRGYELVGIDISKKMLQIAKGLSSDSEGVKRDSYVLADIKHLPFLDSTFDAAFSLHDGLMYMPFDQKLHAFGEISRVLKPGGLMFIDIFNPYHVDRTEFFLFATVGQKRIKTLAYALWPEDVREILRKSQFKLEHLLGGYSLEEKYAPKHSCWRLIIIASKESK